MIGDEWGKYLYYRDQESGEFWSSGWQPRGREIEDNEPPGCRVNGEARHGETLRFAAAGTMQQVEVVIA